jgi:hypothetical protein
MFQFSTPFLLVLKIHGEAEVGHIVNYTLTQEDADYENNKVSNFGICLTIHEMAKRCKNDICKSIIAVEFKKYHEQEVYLLMKALKLHEFELRHFASLLIPLGIRLTWKRIVNLNRHYCRFKLEFKLKEIFNDHLVFSGAV